MKYDKLELIKAERKGGGGRSRRYHYDYSINGRVLSAQVSIGDNVGVFGWLDPKWETYFFKQLMLKERSELPSGRIPIYICPECGDLGCGCVSVKIEKFDDCFVWSELGYENNYEDGIIEVYKMRGVLFNKTEYYAALKDFA